MRVQLDEQLAVPQGQCTLCTHSAATARIRLQASNTSPVTLFNSKRKGMLTCECQVCQATVQVAYVSMHAAYAAGHAAHMHVLHSTAS